MTDLPTLGYDEYIRSSEGTPPPDPDWVPARVLTRGRDSYLVHDGRAPIPAELTVAILRERHWDRSQLGALFHRRYESPDVTANAEPRGGKSPSRDRGRSELPPSPPRRPSG